MGLKRKTAIEKYFTKTKTMNCRQKFTKFRVLIHLPHQNASATTLPFHVIMKHLDWKLSKYPIFNSTNNTNY